MKQGFCYNDVMQVAVTNGQSVVISDQCRGICLNPSGNTDSITIMMPPNPVDAQQMFFATSGIIKHVTILPNNLQSMAAPFISLPIGENGGGHLFVYLKLGSMWYWIL